jgi:hypothetical protein
MSTSRCRSFVVIVKYQMLMAYYPLQKKKILLSQLLTVDAITIFYQLIVSGQCFQTSEYWIDTMVFQNTLVVSFKKQGFCL